MLPNDLGRLRATRGALGAGLGPSSHLPHLQPREWGLGDWELGRKLPHQLCQQGQECTCRLVRGLKTFRSAFSSAEAHSLHHQPSPPRDKTHTPRCSPAVTLGLPSTPDGPAQPTPASRFWGLSSPTALSSSALSQPPPRWTLSAPPRPPAPGAGLSAHHPPSTLCLGLASLS